MQKLFSITDFKNRRNSLLRLIKEKNSSFEGSIFLFADFEVATNKFKQESSFYYFTGINEPGSVLQIDIDGKSTLYIPNFGINRTHWISNCINLLDCNAQDIGFDELKYLGNKIEGYEFYPFFNESEYSNLLLNIKDIIKKGGKIFTLNPDNQYQYYYQRFILDRISKFIINFNEFIYDISDLVAKLRRKKSKREIEALYKAIDITILGHESVFQTLSVNKFENEIQAGIEYIFSSSFADIAFPSIVGSGKNSTIFHYTSNTKKINEGDLVLVDIGAQYEHYCGDITRTYPASGRFNKRQREIYDIVLKTQEYIETLARPGIWLSNKNKPNESLNHLAYEFLKEKGYEQFFIHGIGHFLGLDVHDVGDLSEPLKQGDVITIEPGIYIPNENIGVRIEDNYWLVEDGVVCLSEQLPKDSEEIENLLRK